MAGCGPHPAATILSRTRPCPRRGRNGEGDHHVHGRVRLGVDQELDATRLAARPAVRADVGHVDVGLLSLRTEDGSSLRAEDATGELEHRRRDDHGTLLGDRVPVEVVPGPALHVAEDGAGRAGHVCLHLDGRPRRRVSSPPGEDVGPADDSTSSPATRGCTRPWCGTVRDLGVIAGDAGRRVHLTGWS